MSPDSRRVAPIADVSDEWVTLFPTLCLSDLAPLDAPVASLTQNGWGPGN